MKNNFVKLAGILFLIGAISAGVLAWLNDTTKDIIAQNEAMASMDPAVLEAVMPGSAVFKEEDAALIDTIKADNKQFINLLTAVDASGNEIGKVVRTLSTIKGFNGDMELYVGFSPDGKITGTSVLSHSETEGLGSRTAEPGFMNQFIGKDASGEISESDYDAISGATYSSKSFLSAVNNAIAVYTEYVK
ncbi:MAG: FMN-binding protein [Tissierellia bacterium]|jgi:electron transport complex protein RnfG|nr:FMN-binding protein [Tissierellia bacterium]